MINTGVLHNHVPPILSDLACRILYTGRCVTRFDVNSAGMLEIEIGTICGTADVQGEIQKSWYKS